MTGSIGYGDEIEKYRVAQSIVERHDISFRPTAQRNEIGVGGRTYSGYELGQTLLQVPLYALGKMYSPLVSVPDINWITQLFVGLLNPLVTALTCVLFYLASCSLGFSSKVSCALALILGLGTITWPYSKGFAREPLLGLFLLLSFYAVHRFRITSKSRWLLVAGVASGYLLFTKLIHAVAIPLFLAYIVAVAIDRYRTIQPRPNWKTIALPLARILLLLLLPGLLFLVVQSLYAVIRFGSPFSGIGGIKANPIDWILLLTSQAHPDAATVGLLFSPEKSLFLYSPPVLLFPFAWIVWFRTQAKEALLCLGLLAVEFVSVVSRPDWDGGSWLGPRYLVQVTPLLLMPIGALISRPHRRWFWQLTLVLLFLVGLIVQVVGVLGNPREYMDSTGKGITLGGQWDFLSHGSFDSLVLYVFAPRDPIRLSPFGILLLAVLLVAAFLMIRWMQSGEAGQRVSLSFSWVTAALVLLVEFSAFVIWIVMPYPQVRALQGDSKFNSGNLFRVDGRNREAVAMYSQAVERGSHYTLEAMARVEELTPRVPGDAFTATDLMNKIVAKENGIVEPDENTSLSVYASLKVQVLGEKDRDAFGMSDWITVEPNAIYELSGWMKTEQVYGAGYAVISIAEDNGSWQKQRTLDVVSMDETAGWRLFQRTITTLPTTQRFLVRAGLFQTHGTLWVNDLQLARVTK